MALDADLDAVLALLAEARGVRFGDYRPATLERRVAARVAATGAADLRAYRAVLARDPAEADRLLQALAVGVTSFFRDAPAFAALERDVLRAPPAAGGHPLRAWVVGCSTGEEAWSLAMLLAARPAPASFEVLGTDIDPRALETARAGRYPAAAAVDVPAPLRERFLEPAGPGEVRVVDGLRPPVLFARHDLVGARLAPREAVVASFDLVLCRNVLIYFGERLRDRALERLAAVLSPGGALILGATEGLPAGARGGFDEVVRGGVRVYVRGRGGP